MVPRIPWFQPWLLRSDISGCWNHRILHHPHPWWHFLFTPSRNPKNMPPSRLKNWTYPLKNLHMFMDFSWFKSIQKCQTSGLSNLIDLISLPIRSISHIFTGPFFFKGHFSWSHPWGKLFLSTCTHPGAGGVITEGGQEVHHADHLLSRATATLWKPWTIYR